MEITKSVEREAFLENLALPSRRLAELQRRDAGGAMESTNEVGEIAESDVVGDVGHGLVIIREKPCGTPQSRAQQVLMRGNAEHARKRAQKMERADPALSRDVLELDVALRIGIDPERCFHRSP